MLQIILFGLSVLCDCPSRSGYVMYTTVRNENASGTVVEGAKSEAVVVGNGSEADAARTDEGKDVVTGAAEGENVVLVSDDSRAVESAGAVSSVHTVLLKEERSQSTKETSDEKEVKASGVYSDNIPDSIAFHVFAKRINAEETVDNCEKYTRTMREEIRRLKEELRMLKERRSTGTLLLSTVEQPVEESASEITIVQDNKKVEMLKSKKETLEREYQTLSQIRTRSLEERTNIENEIKIRREELAGLKEQYEHVKDDGAFEERMLELETLYEQNENRIKQLEEEIERLKEENDRLESEYNGNASRHMAALKELQNEIRAIEDEIQQLMDKMNELITDVEEQMLEIEQEITIIEEQIKSTLNERKTVVTRAAPRKVQVVQRAVHPVEVHHVIHQVERPVIKPVEIHHVVRPVTKMIKTEHRVVRPVVKVVRINPASVVHRVERVDNRVEAVVKPAVKVRRVQNVHRIVEPVVRMRSERVLRRQPKKAVLLKKRADEHTRVRSVETRRSMLVRPQRVFVLKTNQKEEKKEKSENSEPEEEKRQLFGENGNAITRMRHAFWNIGRSD
ncbi:hypothetical protein VCUG_01949 [Vavraia culicis subsp. floridensis]|uniref:Uncharacterized protein n=1 Tax=Vavraia culicis (isolate floridensis) TaxID=948595 RepID=L2GSD1_VAVCU|nr:uncharacterized protein VCUG_01949 [Vavraia culicis subsp. floridensis]ELA46571.1 hypothetical protein VCUG_01949 [Vavraia culicis subsp. floridensis]